MGVALPIAAIALTAVGTGIGVIGQVQQAHAQQAQANYQAQVAANQQQIASQAAQQQAAAGEQQAYNAGMRSREVVGAEMAAQGANNVDVNTGSNVDTRSSAAALGQLNALTIRSNSARQAYGLETQATSYGAQQGLYQQQAGQAATGGAFGALGTLVGGASSVAGQYQQWLNATGGSTGGGNSANVVNPGGNLGML